VNFVLDSKHCKRPLSKLEATPLCSSDSCLILVSPTPQLTNTRACTQKSHVTDSRNKVNGDNCTDRSDESKEQCINFYRVKTNITRASLGTSTRCSRLLDAMNSFQW